MTVRHNGKRIDAVAHAGKTGFLYAFDRVTGKPLWPIKERPVPKSDVPGERASPAEGVAEAAAGARRLTSLRTRTHPPAQLRSRCRRK